MKVTSVCIGVLTVAVLLAVGPNAEAQLAKEGTFSGILGWTFPATGVIAVEQDHTVWGGVATGAFRNDAGSGFLHRALIQCTATGEFKKGAVTHNEGDCVATDADGDKAVAKWRCTTCPAAGEFNWTGGTGKYAGLTGQGSYQETGAARPGAGWSAWKGNWQLR